MVDGRMIMKLTGAIGPEVGRIKDSVTEWIINDNPQASAEEIKSKILYFSKEKHK